MKREIKFRAWNSKENKMYIQGNEHDENRSIFWKEWETKSHMSSPMQYTGMTDNSGKEIYEGDINMDYDNKKSEVVFYCGGFYLKYGRTEYKHIGATTDFDRLVIGNIYENPELLA